MILGLLGLKQSKKFVPLFFLLENPLLSNAAEKIYRLDDITDKLENSVQLIVKELEEGNLPSHDKFTYLGETLCINANQMQDRFCKFCMKFNECRNHFKVIFRAFEARDDTSDETIGRRVFPGKSFDKVKLNFAFS